VKVSYSMDGRRVEFRYTLGDSEPRVKSPEMVSNRFSVTVPEGVGLDHIHGDHLALSALLVAYPWVRGRMDFGLPVSSQFAATLEGLGISVGSPTGAPPYTTSPGSVAGLAFSGGVDSTAALSLLPGNTVSVFLDRPSVEGSLYNKEAALKACSSLLERGWECLVVPCDLELVRKPTGFPVDVANGVPAILLAQHLGLGSIAYGSVMESLYSLGRGVYKDYNQTTHYRIWGSMLEASGLLLSYPVAGVSEVGTEIICSKSRLGDLAQSCIRGGFGDPCLKCFKCFRKTAVRVGLGIECYKPDTMSMLLQSNTVADKLGALPVHHEGVIAYAISQLQGLRLPDSVRRRFGHVDDLSFLERWYPSSIRWVPPDSRKAVERRARQFLGAMSDIEQSKIRAWDLKRLVGDRTPLEFPIKDLNR
jgi:hypothetical protein